MAFNINQFRSVINSRGLAKNNLFVARISFQIDSKLSPLEEYISLQDMTFFCRSVSLPDMSLNFAEIRPQGFGKPEKRPSEFTAGQLSGIFMVDSKFGVMKFFHRWMQTVVNIKDYNGVYTEDFDGKLPYEFAYKNEYVATMEILLYSGNDGRYVYTYKFGNVYPLAVGNIDMAWENQAEVMVLPVTFAFDKMTLDAFDLGSASADSLSSSDAVSYAASQYATVQSINQISTPTSIQDTINQQTTVSTIL